jgi:hypothetical protein
MANELSCRELERLAPFPGTIDQPCPLCSHLHNPKRHDLEFGARRALSATHASVVAERVVQRLEAQVKRTHRARAMLKIKTQPKLSGSGA